MKKQKTDVWYIWDVENEEKVGKWFYDFDEVCKIHETLFNGDTNAYEIQYLDLTDPDDKEYFDLMNEDS